MVRVSNRVTDRRRTGTHLRLGFVLALECKPSRPIERDKGSLEFIVRSMGVSVETAGAVVRFKVRYERKSHRVIG